MLTPARDIPPQIHGADIRGYCTFGIVTQSGNRVWIHGKQWCAEGEIDDQFVTLRWRNLDSGAIGVGAYVVVDDHLDGCYCVNGFIDDERCVCGDCVTSERFRVRLVD